MLRSLMAHLRGEPKCGAWCACQLSPKKMTGGSIVSVIA
jgi:hypothetical protein